MMKKIAPLLSSLRAARGLIDARTIVKATDMVSDVKAEEGEGTLSIDMMHEAFCGEGDCGNMMVGDKHITKMSDEEVKEVVEFLAEQVPGDKIDLWIKTSEESLQKKEQAAEMLTHKLKVLRRAEGNTGEDVEASAGEDMDKRQVAKTLREAAEQLNGATEVSAGRGHHMFDGEHYFVDTAFMNSLSQFWPEGYSGLKHIGFGEFYIKLPDGTEIEFDRMRGEDFEGQIGRSHKVYDNRHGRAVEKMIKMAEKARASEAVSAGVEAGAEIDATAKVSVRVAELLPFDYEGLLVGVMTGDKTPSGMDRYDNHRFNVPPQATAHHLEKMMLSRGKNYPGQLIKLYGLARGQTDALMIWTPARGFEVPDYGWEISNLRKHTRKEVARWINGRGANPASVVGAGAEVDAISEGGKATVNVWLAILAGDLTQFDIRLSRRQPNIYRLGHYMNAVNKIQGDMGDAALGSDDPAVLEKLKKSIARRLNLPPADRTIKKIDAYLSSGKMPKYPTMRDR